MLLEELKLAVWQANLELQRRGLVTFTWGNVSGIDREQGLVVIKPSGVAYEDLKVEHMVTVDLAGNKVEGDFKPSSDTATHLILYQAFAGIGGVVHTHSPWATVWAQAGMPIPAFGTTHADYFFGDIPCTRNLTSQEIQGEYEAQTGKVIVETFAGRNPWDVPGVLVKNHGPFSWGKDAHEALHNAVVIEEVARMAYYSKALNPELGGIERALLEKHFLRKHGSGAYYGQTKNFPG